MVDAARLLALGLLLIVLAVITWHVAMKVAHLRLDNLTAVYTVLVTSYVLSRFVLAACHRPPRGDATFVPTVAIIVPAYNEGAAVARTIRACCALDYPDDRLEIVVIDDGSEDDTYEHVLRTAESYPDGTVRCMTLGSNQGKRAAMAAGIRATTAEILVFIDSDSMPAPQAVRRIVSGFADPTIGAIAGLTYARNGSANQLTRMQAARYYVSYQLLKAAESALGAVTCCSGCFSAYRRSAVLDVLDRWEHQTWFGIPCTYGDDRSLTGMLLRGGWRTRYDPRAEAWTDVPSGYRTFFKQQLRWKKSWLREGPLLLGHLWRSRPIAFPSMVAATAAGLLSPVVLLWNVAGVVRPGGPHWPIVYLLGLYLIATAYALVYRTLRRDDLWTAAFTGTAFYIALSPQLLWALLRIRDGGWGTRPSPPSGGLRENNDTRRPSRDGAIAIALPVPSAMTRTARRVDRVPS